MNTNTKTISYASLWGVAIFTAVSLMLFAFNFSFVHAGDPDADTSSSYDTPYDTPNSGYDSVTGTYTEYSNGASSIDTGSCTNGGLSCDSLTYDNGLTIYDYNVNLDTGETTGLAYVNGEYVEVHQVSAENGQETWVYSTQYDGGSSSLSGSSSSDSSGSDITDFTNDTTNSSSDTTSQESCNSFDITCFGSDTSTPSGSAGTPYGTPGGPFGTPYFTPTVDIPPVLTVCSGTIKPGAVTRCSFNILPSSVRKDSKTEIFWYVEGLQAGDTCKLTSIPPTPGLPSWDGVGTTWSSPNNYKVTISQKTIFTLSCTTAGGSTSSVSKTVNIVPEFHEI